MPIGYYGGSYAITIALDLIDSNVTVGGTAVVNGNSPTAQGAGICEGLGNTCSVTNKGAVESVGGLGIGTFQARPAIIDNPAGATRRTASETVKRDAVAAAVLPLRRCLAGTR
jgi:hypothetical protein